ncbi:coenzyme F420-0:L-glutamate ligase [Thermoactinospora rubra]|uniref:coenzyme F420-0:L-glutamate ligase n=1 Tax=Thermoactinospora rubra TaxID=1088767 RepID=UPI000A10DC0B|nr:coenzyme F420-0:L-glutamate ligase [Thermoactinospora rubra]
MIEIFGVPGLPEVVPGDDVAALLRDADLREGDIVVVTSKIVSKAEGRIRRATDRTAAIMEETERVVARRGDTVISQTRHGFVMAAAGVDASNTEPGTVLLLPEDPDASARRIRKGLGGHVGVIITDTFGRPWRHGLTDVAIGAAGVVTLEDFRGRADTHGNPLNVTVTALADEIAAAAELVKGKLSGVPVAVVRGLAHLVTPDDGPGVRPLIRPADEDLFRYGSRDVVHARRTVTAFADRPVNPAAVRRAVAAAMAAPAPERIRFVLAESAEARAKLPGRPPYAVVPCLLGEESAQALLAAGASVENLLIQLAVEGLGSAWTFPELPLAGLLGLPEGWRPLGVVAVGHPAAPPPGRPPYDVDRDVDEVVVLR